MKLTKILTSLLTMVVVVLLAANHTAVAQYVTSKLAPPPPPPALSTQQSKPTTRRAAALDTVNVEFDVHPTIPNGYDDVQGQNEYSLDLKDPSNIKTEAEYDPETGCYIIHTRLGDNDIVTPFIMSASEYNNLAMRQSMMEYYRKKNAESAEEKAKNPFNFLDMQFGLGPLESIFGPGGVQLKTQGSVKINMGVKSNKTDNPALSEHRRHLRLRQQKPQTGL